jgi:hypothetical protein
MQDLDRKAFEIGISRAETSRRQPFHVLRFPLHASPIPFYVPHVSKKSPKIAGLIGNCRKDGIDPHYLGYFECFNRGQFFEAHEVLEELWLADRHGPNGAFYKGLIQLAGAFVHLQKDRPRPAAALFKLARANLEKYPSTHERLDLGYVREQIETRLRGLENGDDRVQSPSTFAAPRLSLG